MLRNLPVTCTRSRAALLEVGRVLNALRKQGLEQAGTIQLVKESIDLIRGFLRGEMVQYKGPRFSVPPPGSRLGFESTKDLPIYVGATGPAMLRLAGQHTDGVLFNHPCTPSFVEYAMPFIDEGLKLSGRTIEDFDVAAYLLVAVDEDKKELWAQPSSSLHRSYPLGILRCFETQV
jgi:5,10-methylenetetrahydromethanopterin reductase